MTGSLNSYYPSRERSWLQSPIFDFSSLTSDPILTFNLFCDTVFFDAVTLGKYWDGLTVQMTTGIDGHWETIGSVVIQVIYVIIQAADSYWYNTDDVYSTSFTGGTPGFSYYFGRWMPMRHVLTGAKQKSNVILRFAFGSDHDDSSNGVLIDDIQIFTTGSDTDF